jgi:hypothetical protein
VRTLPHGQTGRRCAGLSAHYGSPVRRRPRWLLLGPGDPTTALIMAVPRAHGFNSVLFGANAVKCCEETRSLVP